jgi:competence protein ComEA
VNLATAEELRLLPGIGPTLAQRIVESRSLRGPFTAVEQLARVRGIGPKTVARVAKLLVVAPAQSGKSQPTDSVTAR